MMCYVYENIFPGKVGKTFLVTSDDSDGYQTILKVLGKIKGISKMHVNDRVYPREITIYTESPVSVKEVQESVRNVGFHALPKSFFLQ